LRQRSEDIGSIIDELVGAKIFGFASTKRGQSGKNFVVAKVCAAGGDGESIFVDVNAFTPEAQSALLAFQDGDSASIAGELTSKCWTDKNSVVISRSGCRPRGLDRLSPPP
jgi:hypothetical protein